MGPAGAAKELAKPENTRYLKGERLPVRKAEWRRAAPDCEGLGTIAGDSKSYRAQSSTRAPRTPPQTDRRNSLNALNFLSLGRSPGVGLALRLPEIRPDRPPGHENAAHGRPGAAQVSALASGSGHRRRDPAAAARSARPHAPSRRRPRPTGPSCGHGGRKLVPDPVLRSVAPSRPSSPCLASRRLRNGACFLFRWDRGAARPDGTSNGAHWKNISALAAEGTAAGKARGRVSVHASPHWRPGAATRRRPRHSGASSHRGLTCALEHSESLKLTVHAADRCCRVVYLPAIDSPAGLIMPIAATSMLDRHPMARTASPCHGSLPFARKGLGPALTQPPARSSLFRRLRSRPSEPERAGRFGSGASRCRCNGSRRVFAVDRTLTIVRAHRGYRHTSNGIPLHCPAPPTGTVRWNGHAATRPCVRHSPMVVPQTASASLSRKRAGGSCAQANGSAICACGSKTILLTRSVLLEHAAVSSADRTVAMFPIDPVGADRPDIRTGPGSLTLASVRRPAGGSGHQAT